MRNANFRDTNGVLFALQRIPRQVDEQVTAWLRKPIIALLQARQRFTAGMVIPPFEDWDKELSVFWCGNKKPQSVMIVVLEIRGESYQYSCQEMTNNLIDSP